MVRAFNRLADVSAPITGFGAGLYRESAAPTTRLAEVLTVLVTVLTIFGGLAFLFWFVIGAVQWASAGGNPEQVNKAKSQISTAVAGLFILILATSLIWIVGKVTGLDIINIEATIDKVLP